MGSKEEACKIVCVGVGVGGYVCVCVWLKYIAVVSRGSMEKDKLVLKMYLIWHSQTLGMHKAEKHASLKL